MRGSPTALDMLLQRSPEDQERKGYRHTASEIASQPSVWLKTLGAVQAAAPELSTFMSGSRRLLLAGAGSSHYVGLSTLPLLASAYGCVEAIPSTEILMDPESALPREPFVLVSFARSGESPEGNAIVLQAERRRSGLVRQLAVTCNRSGGLAHIVGSLEERGFVLALPEESNDKALAMTSSFTSLCLAGASLAYLERQADYAAIVEDLARGCEGLLARAADLGSRLADEEFERAFFVASRPLLGGAFEARLKVQELTAGRIIASAEDCLGFRHGPMAAVDRGSLVVLYVSRDSTRRLYEFDLLRELRDKGLGKRIVAASPDVSGLEGLADEVLDLGGVSSVPDAFLPVLVAVTGQLIGLFASLRQDLAPDEPSPGGVISRVVKGVRIHAESVGK